MFEQPASSGSPARERRALDHVLGSLLGQGQEPDQELLSVPKREIDERAKDHSERQKAKKKKVG